MKWIFAFILSVTLQASEFTMLVAGQSNAVGYTPGAWNAGPKVKTWSGTAWSQAADPLPFFSNPPIGCSSPWTLLGSFVAQHYDQVNLMGSGEGGRSITWWDEGQQGWS